MAGVGTNRYSYSFNDPTNLSDPNGNWFHIVGGAALSVLVDLTIAVINEERYTLSDGVKSATVGAVGAATGVGIGNMISKAQKISKRVPSDPLTHVDKVGAGGYGGADAGAAGELVNQVATVDQTVEYGDLGLDFGAIDGVDLGKASLSGMITGGAFAGAGAKVVAVVSPKGQVTGEVVEIVVNDLSGKGGSAIAGETLDRLDPNDKDEDDDDL